MTNGMARLIFGECVERTPRSMYRIGTCDPIMEQRVPKAHATPERVLRLVYSHPCTAIGSCAGYIPIHAL